MQRNTRWIIGIITGLLIAIGGYFFIVNLSVSAQPSGGVNMAAASSSQPIAIRPADAFIGAVSAAGYVELVSEQVVALEVSGVISEIPVSVGDTVQNGDLLLALDVVDLQRTVQRQQLAVESARNTLDELTEAADVADIAVAEADLKEAEENLADVLDGPSADEIAAAESSLASAWSLYGELRDGPSDAELTQLSADLKKKEVALAEARRAHEEIAWRNDVGMTAEAAAFEQATIDYEAAQAAYEETVAPADASDLQSALSAAQNAQVQLDDLLDSPTEAEIAPAEARVADAAAALTDLLDGADATDLRAAEITLEQALLDLEEAYTDLAAAQVAAPIDGTVLSIDAEVGERLSEGFAVVTLADPQQLELTIDVAEVDVVRIAEGQSAIVEIDALSGRQFEGIVSYIAPASETDAGVVHYPVTIRLVDETQESVRPGMTAVATIEATVAVGTDAWFVPTSAITMGEDGAVVTMIRGEDQQTVQVLPGAVQGEWTAVTASDLQFGDQVLAELTSYMDGETASEFVGPGPGSGSPFGQR